MPKARSRRCTVQQQITAFEQQNPKLAEAMNLFGVTMAKYQDALYALNGPRVYQSNSTVKLDGLG